MRTLRQRCHVDKLNILQEVRQTTAGRSVRLTAIRGCIGCIRYLETLLTLLQSGRDPEYRENQTIWDVCQGHALYGTGCRIYATLDIMVDTGKGRAGPSGEERSKVRTQKAGRENEEPSYLTFLLLDPD